jgi:hypothetical protein
MQLNQHPAGTNGREESSHDADYSKNRPPFVVGFLRNLPGNPPRPTSLGDFPKSEGYEFAPNHDLDTASDRRDGYLPQFFDNIQSSFFHRTPSLIHCRADRRNF